MLLCPRVGVRLQEETPPGRVLLYWDLQLLHVGGLSTLYEMDKHVGVDPHGMNCPPQSTHPKAFTQVVGGRELCGGGRGVRRLKKAARQSWASSFMYLYVKCEMLNQAIRPGKMPLNAPGYRGSVPSTCLTSDRDRNILKRCG
ncbi:hypothetical protein EYF80_048306 [Liparis tanakae]|uniref:Uncharacterized protein n=1 Tax=Liparis tanakae TaxID=230148 RepID=A0A4Z2FKM6_9TELE|nr:hypothetical protein EYF80_048306 [Liparis tanakae]